MAITDRSFSFKNKEIQNKMLMPKTAAQDVIRAVGCPDLLSVARGFHCHDHNMTATLPTSHLLSKKEKTKQNS